VESENDAQEEEGDLHAEVEVPPEKDTKKHHKKRRFSY